MNFLITGATGFIGRHLTDQLTLKELITKGQFVYPKKAIDCGFTFHYPKLPEALASLR
ncbi:DUF1731 domain-containing protein [Oceanobacillus alkalisoli]|uniref:DUF1731 domain-containing protein n=1 Tax=Oceanobacillus alkalisoli TaxID=2925113 RepID=UPI001EE3F6A9|nr:DUF1731 domain-containing protein [Oceanobacillus alkalisoli]MCG5104988.1 DUF1731 domain-containing protein [Oceanobacillus alkalisoli]